MFAESVYTRLRSRHDSVRRCRSPVCRYGKQIRELTIELMVPQSIGKLHRSTIEKAVITNLSDVKMGHVFMLRHGARSYQKTRLLDRSYVGCGLRNAYVLSFLSWSQPAHGTRTGTLF